MDWSDAAIKQSLGELRGVPTSGALVRYVAGCMKRERERIARIVESTQDPQEVARLLRDESEDAHVFKLAGPLHKLPEKP
ncbi:MAG TPA: hypothetical protein VGN57_08840 [Pirellulaceae bacterium]|nr:hypothetical protein [Pirellulaceae bacterium]